MEDMEEYFPRKELRTNLFWTPPLFWALKWKSPLHLGLLIPLIIHAFSSLHRPYDGAWDIVGAEVEESFYLKALPQLEFLYNEFILYGNKGTTHGMCLRQFISPLIPCAILWHLDFF